MKKVFILVCTLLAIPVLAEPQYNCTLHHWHSQGFSKPYVKPYSFKLSLTIANKVYVLRKKMDEYEFTLELNQGTRIAVALQEDSENALFESVVFDSTSTYGKEKAYAKMPAKSKNIFLTYGNSNDIYTIECDKIE